MYGADDFNEPWTALVLAIGGVFFVCAVIWSYRDARRCSTPGCKNRATWVNDRGLRYCDRHVPPTGSGWIRLPTRYSKPL